MEGSISILNDMLESPSDASFGLAQLDLFLLDLLPDIEQYQNNHTLSPQLEELIKLQDSFGYNLTTRLVKLYNLELSIKDIALLNGNLQVLLLLHPKSKTVFNCDRNMSGILDVLNKYKGDKFVIISTITTLIHILLKDYNNYRSFERGFGCPLLIQHITLDTIDDITVDDAPQSSSGSSHKANMLYSEEQLLNFKIIEFLMLYMSEEIGNPDPYTVEMKTDLFRDELPEIDFLVQSLNELNKL
ncbi:hypothetical protein CANMA_002020 [Candida margitis]|uniref:uncharacterized protein n=1 Tax=Candida margitis TaxID=1775924 RepID=UPI0022266669|nr:uncharacterized protein CANMA_002020 [Candida margitis]KAI5968846.1 hypothetical protein CANMA_002020 [Candida margitis]